MCLPIESSTFLVKSETLSGQVHVSEVVHAFLWLGSNTKIVRRLTEAWRGSLLDAYLSLHSPQASPSMFAYKDARTFLDPVLRPSRLQVRRGIFLAELLCFLCSFFLVNFFVNHPFPAVSIRPWWFCTLTLSMTSSNSLTY